MIEEINSAIDQENLLKGKTVVITGAGSGIGKEIARSFSNKGADLILLSKSTEKLNMIYDEIIANSSARVLIQSVDFESAEEKDYEDIYWCIVTDQVPAEIINEYFEDKNFYRYYIIRRRQDD